MCIGAASPGKPVIPPDPARFTDPNVQSARNKIRPAYGYAQTVLTGALAPPSGTKKTALG